MLSNRGVSIGEVRYIRYQLSPNKRTGMQYWANVGHKYWTDIGKTRCTILAQYWVQYCPNIGSATQRQYWPIFLANTGPILATNIGPILGEYVVQF